MAFVKIRKGSVPATHPALANSKSALEPLLKLKLGVGNFVLADEQQQWTQHCAQPIPLDADGQAIIHLSGAAGRGLVTQVPSELWHALTFNHSWNLDHNGYAIGTWKGEGVKLHVMVYYLLHPSFVPTPGITIDHINNERLDQAASNLRPATRSLQSRNKKKKPGTSGDVVGIFKVNRQKHPDRPWQALFRYQKKRYDAGYWKTKEAAEFALDKMKARVIPDYVKMNQ